MALTASQLDQLHQALLEAFTRDDLRRLLRVRMEVDFDHVASEKRQRDQVWELVCWADREGRAVELAQAAAAEKPAKVELQAMAIAAQGWDPTPAPPTAEPGTRTYLWVNVPPPPTQPPIGRDTLVASWVDQLKSGQTRALAVHGMPGVGKTTLAILLAHDARLHAHCADGVLWASLGPNGSGAAVQASWADKDALNVDLSGVVDPITRHERLNRAVGERRLLVVLDDVWDLATAQMLRLSGPHVVHVLTTRNEEIAVEFATAAGTVRAPTLDDAMAWTLLQRLAPAACADDPQATIDLAATAGGLPLVVELLGGYLAAPQRTKFAGQRKKARAAAKTSAERLALATVRLGSATGQAETLAAMIGLSIADLEQTAPDTVPVFWALGAFAPKPATFDTAAAQTVAAADEEVLSLLAGRNLLEISADEQLAVHQVVHDVMGTRMAGEVRERHAQFYLDLVDEDRGDWQRIEGVYPQVRYAWQQLGDDDARLLAFMWALRIHFNRRGLSTEQIAWAERALAYARAQQDDKTTATLLTNIGAVYDALGDKRQGVDYYQRALSLFRQVGDKGGEAITLNNIGFVYSALGDKRQALDYYEQALPLSRQVGDKGGEATTLNNIGRVYHVLGNKRQALDYYEQSLPLYRQAGNKSGEATVLNNIGMFYSDLGDKRQALDYYARSLPLFREVGDKVGESQTLTSIGGISADLGDQRQALDYFEQSLALRRQVGDKGGEATTLNNIGGVYSALGDQRQALDYFEQALPLRRQVEDKGGEAITLLNMALAALGAGEHGKAATGLVAFLAVYKELDEGLVEGLGLAPLVAQVQALFAQARPIGPGAD